MHTNSSAIIDRGIIGPMFGDNDVDDETDTLTSRDMSPLAILAGICILVLTILAAVWMAAYAAKLVYA